MKMPLTPFMFISKIQSNNCWNDIYEKVNTLFIKQLLVI